MGLIASAFGFVGLATAASADGGCSAYSTYAALGGAAGLGTLQSTQGVTLVSTADASLPAAQAQYDSVNGSSGWAGAPYSQVAANNVGAATINANDVPVFATSSNPGVPETSKSTPVSSLSSKSDEKGTTAKASSSVSSSDNPVAGSITTAAGASCDDDGTLAAIGDAVEAGINVKGVLSIVSVRSHAQASIDPKGQQSLQGTMMVEGTAVAGVPVAITDQGVVTGSSTVPRPDDPVTKPLRDAGISVRYVAVDKDGPKGQVLAPAVEITVSETIPGVGSGPVATTYTFGRAYARVSTSGGGAESAAATPDVSAGQSASPEPAAAPATAGFGAAPVSPASGGTADAPAVAPVAAAPASPGRSGRVESVPAVLAASSSLSSIYLAVAVCGVLLVIAWAMFETVGVRVRWR